MCLLWKSHLLQINTPFTRSSQGSSWAGTAAALPCRFKVFAFSISPLCTSSAFFCCFFSWFFEYILNRYFLFLCLSSTFPFSTFLNCQHFSSILHFLLIFALHPFSILLRFVECFAVYLIPPVFTFSHSVCICVFVCQAATVLHTFYPSWAETISPLLKARGTKWLNHIVSLI